MSERTMGPALGKGITSDWLLGPSAFEQQRRRTLWSFLTWAFFLSEVVNAHPAEANLAWPVVEEPDDRPAPPQDNPNNSATLTSDEPMFKDWAVPAAPDRALDISQARLLVQPQLPIGSFDKLMVGDGPAAHGLSSSTFLADGIFPANPLQESTTGADATEIAWNGSPSSVDAAVFLDLGQLGGWGLGPSGDFAQLIQFSLAAPPDIASNGVSIVGSGLSGVTDGLVSSAVLAFGAPPAEQNSLFAEGRYTDYSISLQTEHSLASVTGPLGSGAAEVPDLVNDLVALHFAHPEQHSASSIPGPTAALEELTLRHAIDHLL